MDARNYYNDENREILERYKRGLVNLKAVYEETKNPPVNEELKEFYKFVHHAGGFLLELAYMERSFDESYFERKSFQELREENYTLYKELIGDNYKESYANPTYAVWRLGENYGQLLSALYVRVRGGISHAYKHKLFLLLPLNESLEELFNLVKAEGLNYEGMKAIVNKPMLDKKLIVTETACDQSERIDPDFSFYMDIIEKAKEGDLRYLFKLDKYISENEIRTAKFLQNYPEDKLKALSKSIVDSFLRSFLKGGKSREGRDMARIFYAAGQELIIHELRKTLMDVGLRSTIGIISSTNPNKQYEYDHRFDEALYLDEAYTNLREEAQETAYQSTVEVVKFDCGPLVFKTFGEKPFTPENKKECLRLSENQAEIKKRHGNKMYEIEDKYMPGEKTSFCIIAFPNSEIGEQFEAIFEDTMKVNMMDNSKYELIQKTIIDVLDNKEIVARENEHSALRKEDINKAYTGVHTDITIPYEEIEFIRVVHKDGRSVDIIRNGRFVLEGTEELNRAFE